jgi:hypothetical protein
VRSDSGCSLRLLLLVTLLLQGVALGQEVTAVLRQGVYADSDDTQVYRTLLAGQVSWTRFTLGVNEAVDAITSASTDVRSSPFVDATTGASVRRRRSPAMSDGRSETNLTLLGHDDVGHNAGGSVVFAAEGDYLSVGGGLQVAWDFFERNTTLFGGLNLSGNQIKSAVDHAFSRALLVSGYSLGWTQILSQNDVLTLRYDGSYLDGYQASPYRAVRFGDWQTTLHPGTNGITFTNTLGPETGLPERIPGTRLRHAGTLQWVRGLGPHLAVSPQYRLAYDDWGVFAQTALVELRGLFGARWQARLTYRFYDQSGADFWKGKYLHADAAYSFYTADKELGDIVGHSANGDVSVAVWKRPTGAYAALVDARLEYLHYAYPGFVLLTSRTSLFGELGVRFQF